MDKDFEFETERSYARRFTFRDVNHIFDLDSDPEVHRFLGNNPIKTIAQAEEVIDKILNQYREVGFGRLALILKDTGEFIGWSGIKLEKGFLEEPYYDMGYRLKRAFWGMGYATEPDSLS